MTVKNQSVVDKIQVITVGICIVYLHSASLQRNIQYQRHTIESHLHIKSNLL